MSIRYPIALLVAVSAGLLLFQTANRASINDEQVWQHRNLGKAFYENPTTQKQAVTEFKKALDLAPDSVRERINYGLSLLRAGDTEEGIHQLELAQKQDPSLPHTWFNLGIQNKRLRQYDTARQQLLGMIERVPDDAITHYNLGIVYKLTDKLDLAIRSFETTAKLNPDLAAPRFQLYNIYREAEKEKDAERELAAFRAIKAQQTDPEASDDMEWNFFAEIHDPIDTKPEDLAIRAKVVFRASSLAGGVDGASSGAATLDLENDGIADLILWSSRGVVVVKGGKTVTGRTGLEELKGIRHIAPGDFDGDSLADLCILTAEGPLLYRNTGGTFAPFQAKLPGGEFDLAFWLDYDHDYDQDLLLFGAKPVLVRNQGKGGFAVLPGAFPFASGKALSATLYHLIADEKSTDLVVTYADRPAVLYRDMLLARYRADTLNDVPAGATSIQQVDYDNEGWMDLAFFSKGQIHFMRNHEGVLKKDEQVLEGAASFAFIDLENRAVSDLVTGDKVYRNEGLGRYSRNAAVTVPNSRLWIAADFDRDGRVDLASLAGDRAQILSNQTSTRNNWVALRLTGVKNMPVPHGTEVEMKSGTAYQKVIYENTPITLGLRGRKAIDTIRITWPNGLVQNLTEQGINQYSDVKEAPRLSGSCPMIFTWDGKRFRFLTDVLGVAPLGASAGDGQYFPVDHDEYVQIPGHLMVPKDGAWEIRITEELAEVSYLDQIRLITVDHPADVEIFSNDKWKSPPFPEFRLFGVKERVYPKRVVDHRNRDFLAAVTRLDQRYADGFQRDHAGAAELHALEIDFGRQAAPRNEAVLILNGWVDWADGSTFLAKAQEGAGGLQPPYLQVRDRNGEWKTVIDDLGMPSGKTKTIAVDLSGKFLSASRELRIITNLAVYWDEIFLGEDTSAPEARLTPIDSNVADLQFRGFSRAVIHPQRKQPEYFDYSVVTPVGQWNPTPGMYTRFGDVRNLLRHVDDKLVVMGAGDELTLRFPVSAVPPLPAGWKRNFLLLVDGWAKDRDANTAYSQTVEPLPFHGMTTYPFAPGERYPQSAELEEYRRAYNTRPALRLLRPLVADRPAKPGARAGAASSD